MLMKPLYEIIEENRNQRFGVESTKDLYAVWHQYDLFCSLFAPLKKASDIITIIDFGNRYSNTYELTNLHKLNYEWSFESQDVWEFIEELADIFKDDIRYNIQVYGSRDRVKTGICILHFALTFPTSEELLKARMIL